MSAGEYVLHGLKLSYFTGKLEAYLRVKGVPHRFVGMDMADFRACARATGIAQMPQLETPDGGWLTDTTAILRRFEDEGRDRGFGPLTLPPASSACCLRTPSMNGCGGPPSTTAGPSSRTPG